MIHADETPLRVFKEPSRTADQKSYIWAYASSKRAAVQNKRNKPFDENHPEDKSSSVILSEYWAWIDSLGATSGKLADAVKNAKNQKAPLEAFLKHGEIEISNNQGENAIRPIVIGRKNWLFCDTPEGAQASAIIFQSLKLQKQTR